MKVLMFGWEFPPVLSGGLGIACHGIVQALIDKGIDVTLVLPFLHKNMPIPEKRLQYIHALEKSGGTIHIELIDALLQPYLNADQYAALTKNRGLSLYGDDLWSEVKRYASLAADIAKTAVHDVIHCHDWLTILAGIQAKSISGKPLVFHVHALEQDRSPQNPNPLTCAIEQQGLQAADTIIAVSRYMKQRIMRAYQIPATKISVVYNGHVGTHVLKTLPYRKERFTVLFLGRVTEQKGAHYFIQAARKILSHRQDIEFIIAGEGDQLPYAIETCAQLGISSHVHFTGFLNRADVSRFYQACDVYVMPSVSEPFGIVCLEAIAHGIPVVISKQSGVSEVLTHSLKVDYWDTDQLASKILGVLDYPALKNEMLLHAKRELTELTWASAAQKIIHCYNQSV